MDIIDRKPISTPVWVRISISIALAALLTLAAYWFTLNPPGNFSGKSTLFGAVLLLPLVFAVKAGWSLSLSVTFAFAAYSLVCLTLVWFITREKAT